MTERYNALVVVLENDTREDDAQHVIDAVRMLRGVVDVKPHVADINSVVGEMRARNKIWAQLVRIFHDEEKKDAGRAGSL